MNYIDYKKKSIMKSIDDLIESLYIAKDDNTLHDILFKIIFKFITKDDDLFKVLLNTYKNRITINTLYKVDSKEFMSNITGEKYNDIELKGNMNVIVAETDLNIDFIFVIEVQRSIQYSIPVRLFEYCGAINMSNFLNIFEKSNIHEITKSDYYNKFNKLPVIIPVIINLNSPYKYINEGYYVSDGIKEYNYYRDYCDINIDVTPRELLMIDFNWYQIDFIDLNLEESILNKFIELYVNYSEHKSFDKFKEDISVEINNKRYDVDEIFRELDKKLLEITRMQVEDEMKDTIKRKDEELERKDEELERKDEELERKDEELERKDEELERKDEELLQIIINMYDKGMEIKLISDITNINLETIKEIIDSYCN